MRMWQWLIALSVVIGFSNTAAAATGCLFTPWLNAVHSTSAVAIDRPTVARMQAAKSALAELELRRFAFDPAVRFGLRVEMFLISRRQMVETFRTSGPEGVRRMTLAVSVEDAAQLVKYMSAPANCSEIIETKLSGEESGSVSAAPASPAIVSDNIAAEAAPQPKSSLPKGDERVSAASLTSLPVSWLAIGVVTTIFAGVIFLVVRRQKRGYARFVCFLAVELSVANKRTTTHLIELSQSGAKISITKPINPGSMVSIHFDGAEIRAGVVWSNASCMGVRFTETLTGQHLANMLEKAGGGFERQYLAS